MDRRNSRKGGREGAWQAIAASLLVSWTLLESSTLQAAITPELQKAAREATFEVVLAKPVQDPLGYEKPLPLELEPFATRNDRYRSIGTAFALGQDTFVSAAHVLVAGASGQSGMPELRDASGKVYAIDRILKFSQLEDYAVFSLKDPPKVHPLEPVETLQPDDPVLAVGNALGEGVIIREGLYTSATPEQQDGRWKWLRFSAAASPGNSGGPLLSASGRVAGVVEAKSQNENLNYALPIANVLKGSTHAASFGRRGPFGLPMLQQRSTMTFEGEIALPKGFAAFAQEYRALVAANQQRASAALLQSASATLWPAGQSQKLLATVDADANPRLILQEQDGTWQARRVTYTRTDLDSDGYVATGFAGGQMLVRLKRPAYGSSADFHADGELFGKLLLRGWRLPRVVGTELVRVTSLGKPARDELHVDRHGRRWQLRAWPLPHSDAMVLALLLPTPDGYAGLLRVGPAVDVSTGESQLELLADYVAVSYEGTLPQWQAFLAATTLRPESLAAARLVNDAATGVTLTTPRFTARLTRATVPWGERSQLDLHMNYVSASDGLHWDITGLRAVPDRDRGSWLVLDRVPRPGEGAGKDAEQRWDQMLHRRNDFSSTPLPNPDLKSLWIATVVDGTQRVRGDLDADSRYLYSLVCATDRQQLPRELYEMQRLALQGIRVLEK